MKPAMKKIVRPVLDEAEKFAKETKRQILAKPLPAPEETQALADPQPIQQAKQQDEEETEAALGQARMEKSKLLAEQRDRYQQIQREELAASKQREQVKETKEREETKIKEEKEKSQPEIGGESALVATGASQKKPSGLFGLGRGRKSFKWATATGERKGQAPH